jgi:hypothetical protein
VIVLQVVTHLMGFKLKYNFSNQCYNDIVKLIINQIPVKHNMSKDLYQSKKIVSGLRMNYEKIDTCEKNCMLFCKEHKNDTECIHCVRSIYVKVINEDRGICHHKSGGQIGSLHTYHIKAETVVPV